MNSDVPLSLSQKKERVVLLFTTTYVQGSKISIFLCEPEKFLTLLVKDQDYKAF